MDKSYSRRFVRGGNETARFCAVISVSEDSVGGFYLELAEACERFCEENIASLEEYRKRGCRTAKYVFEVSEVGRTDGEIDMSMRVYICHGSGNSETLFEEMHRWSVSGDAMLMPRKRREKAKKSAKALKKIKNIEKSS